jgi:hypothetical protein
MRKRCLAVSLAAGSLLLSGCSGLRQLQPDQFLGRAQGINIVHSYPQYYRYIGTTGEKVFIEYKRNHVGLLPGTHVVYWTYVTNLPPQIKEQLNAGENPWATAPKNPRPL